MKKKLIIVIILLVALIAAIVVVLYTSNDGAWIEEKLMKGLTFNLSDEWTYDEEYQSYSNPKNEWATYTACESWDDNECATAEERKKTFEPDGSDGFDISDIKVNGTDALLVHEPVNEIDDYYVFFYVNGKEHIINYETPFGENPIADLTEEFLASISW